MKTKNLNRQLPASIETPVTEPTIVENWSPEFGPGFFSTSPN